MDENKQGRPVRVGGYIAVDLPVNKKPVKENKQRDGGYKCQLSLAKTDFICQVQEQKKIGNGKKGANVGTNENYIDAAENDPHAQENKLLFSGLKTVPDGDVVQEQKAQRKKHGNRGDIGELFP